MILSRLNAVPQGHGSSTCTGPWPPPATSHSGSLLMRAATAGTHGHAAPHGHEAHPVTPDDSPGAASRSPPPRASASPRLRPATRCLLSALPVMLCQLLPCVQNKAPQLAGVRCENKALQLPRAGTPTECGT